jgi:N-acetylmuramoyl-L-alanine amidase
MSSLFQIVRSTKSLFHIARLAAALLSAALILALAITTPVRAQDNSLSALARIKPAGSLITDQAQALRMKIALSQGVPWRVFTLSNPNRVVFDFREVDWTGLTRAAMLNSDQVSDLRFGNFRPGLSRLVVTLAAPQVLDHAGMTINSETGEAQITALFSPASQAEFDAKSGTPGDPVWDLPEPALPAATPRDPDRPLTIVLDPGHGGIDPGAQRGKVQEKELMLSLAFAVEEALLRSGESNVIMTRRDDSFVSLERRVAIAHEVGADLFISLHADSLPSGRARGATFYTLAAEATDEASAKLAERHSRDDLLSGIDLTGKDDVVAGVLMDLARLETAPRSIALARSLGEGVGNVGAPLNSNPMRAADFSVLKAADIPSVLVEVGFLSSDRDRRNLTDPDFMLRVAGGIRDGILIWHLKDDAKRPLMRQ